MSKKLLFNFNREVIQNYTYVKYVGAIITATNTLEKPIKSAILKGSTKYRDIDTGEVLDAFEDGRNLELVSVEMPVLTTTGKNLFPNMKFIYRRMLLEDSGNIIDAISDDWACDDYLEVPTQKTMYTNMKYIGLKWSKVCFYDENKNYISFLINDDTINFPENAKYWRVGAYAEPQYGDLFNQVMLCKSLEEAHSTYEPYKTNILTVNEDVTLRGVGDVKDELNLLTGELTQRIGEVVLDGSEDETWNNTLGNHYVDQETKAMCLPKSFIELPVVNTGKTNTMVNNFKVLNTGYTNGQGYGVMAISTHDTWHIQFVKQGVKTVEKWREFLQSNPIKIKYQLTTESVKTVDLSILDQNENKVSSISSFNDTTHITASSETIPPIFEGYLATKEVE